VKDEFEASACQHHRDQFLQNYRGTPAAKVSVTPNSTLYQKTKRYFFVPYASEDDTHGKGFCY
jgi:hypothetical protein